MEKDLADFAVNYAQKLGASYAEARLESSKSNSFLLKNGNLDSSGFSDISGLGIRLICNKGLGFVSTNKLEKTKIKSLIKIAIKSAKSSEHREEVNLAEDNVNKKEYKVKQKIKLANVDPSEKIQLLLDAEKAIKATGIKTPGRYFTLSDHTTTEYLVNSEGTQVLATVPKVAFMYFLTIKEGNQSVQRYWQYGNAGGFEFVKSWNISELLVNEVKACYNNLKNGRKLKKEKLDVIAAPQVVGIMVHESVGHPYEADRILGREGAQAGESFVSQDMIGQKIGSDVVTVVDDPTVENSYGFYLYDNEGVKAKRKYLMKNGKINDFLHNRQTAALMGIKSNGSSRSVDYDKESIVRMSNTFMLPSKKKEEELIEDIKRGVYIKNFMEWNIDDKRVNQKYVGAEAYLIENGQLGMPVKSPIMEVSTFDLYKAVDAVANNTEFHAGNCGKGEPMQAIPVWFGGPSIRLRGLWIK
ncbi:MAG: Zinc metalloprotease TldD [Candidatus Woesearchaeota archaeon]|nr:Zinc metalloprotease TldD [Candidatus Woesearchaeota archaeon]